MSTNHNSWSLEKQHQCVICFWSSWYLLDLMYQTLEFRPLLNYPDRPNMNYHYSMIVHKDLRDLMEHLGLYARLSYRAYYGCKYFPPNKRWVARRRKKTHRAFGETIMRWRLFTNRFNFTAKMVLANEYEQISVPFLKWQTFNFRGAWWLTSAVKELENNRSIIHTSS